MSKPIYKMKMPPQSENWRNGDGVKSVAVLDRCGNNWKNGKGGFGILMHEEYAPCCATMFQPFVVLKTPQKPKKENK